ncbi:hypothetical protein [Agrobacterium tumefaciens]|uniref:hypothetical protein n=1 Tax=Agrobacterium tumefaciens TaxID=358 RepID=UPI0015747234|nr:hypothetical protein [Agrobacterium tumefaciens]WCK04241.1 hypothetical protein G6L31_016510 [Agrobacterium tumefaciens]
MNGIQRESSACEQCSEDRVKAQHRKVHFANLFPLEFEIAFLLPVAPGVIQRMKMKLFFFTGLTPRQTEQIESKRMKSLRHVRLLCSTLPYPPVTGKNRQYFP